MGSAPQWPVMPDAQPKGRPFPRRLVAYLDILGWSGRTRAEANYDLFSAVGVARLFGDIRIMDKMPGYSIKSSLFSDSIVFSCEPTPDETAQLVSRVQQLYLALLP